MTESTDSFSSRLQKEFTLLVDKCGLKQAKVKVTAKPLSPEDAIGSTRRKDYVLLKGKERLLQAEVMGCRGQAFTGSLGDFTGTLEDVLALPLIDDFQRAVYTATLNAVACHAGKVLNTIHCRNEGPEECARQAVEFFRKEYGKPRILMIGYQPALAEALHKAFPLVVLDLDPANIGQNKKGVVIEDGSIGLAEHIADSDVIFATGSTICNSTIDALEQSGKPLVFFGTTGSGAAALLGIPRFCPASEAGRNNI
ncbi:Rossmann-like domain-containing protein [Pelotomaculum propionicicum]|uniref:Putative heavy-metal chelation domain-containing protein n=1 Tax=Pelotomaculum propionicicum TaxID=258475 RepID=A0A4Y7RT66_9FIRM|nr:DUF364 domain-containing protein [Pelotomaculum propionicicum]NLI12001.1 hypothetical protein [Peptococcaceae bacterium]TEB11447.1 hypothetical protein Pmgp_01635 [Pelotomaculum propionicicum]